MTYRERRQQRRAKHAQHNEFYRVANEPELRNRFPQKRVESALVAQSKDDTQHSQRRPGRYLQVSQTDCRKDGQDENTGSRPVDSRGR